MITMDFETRSRADLKTGGAYFYAAHPSTEILCLVWESGGKIFKWSPFENLGHTLEQFYQCLSANPLIEAHNCEFEWAIWNYCGVKKYGFKPLPQERFLCSAAKAASLALPRDLFSACKVTGTKSQKDMEGYMLMMKMCKPDRHGNWVYDAEKLNRLTSYCQVDVKSEIDLSKSLHPLISKEQELFHLNARMNRRGIPIDLYTVRIAQNFLERYSETKRAELKAITNGKVETEGQTAKIKDFCNGLNWGHEMLGVDVIEVERALSKNPPKVVKKVLEIRRDLGLASVKKIKRMQDIVMPDNRIRGSMLYCGAARTGRWSSKGVQFQNLARGTGNVNVLEVIETLQKGIYSDFISKYPDVIKTLSECIRGFIEAPEGKVFMAGDYASIEVRVLFWLAGQTDALNILAKGIDIYKEMASTIYGIHPMDVIKIQRQLGKALVLACGYGQGYKKFITTCSLPPYNMTIDTEFSKKAVYGYRARFSKVVDFWKDCENAFKNTILQKNVVFNVGKVTFCGLSDRTIITLPSGRKLYYFNPQIKVVDFKTKKEIQEMDDEEEMSANMTEQLCFLGMNSKSGKWERIYTYGGHIVENITQGVARDILGESLIKLEKNGFPPIFTVHDENVCEVEAGTKTLEEFTKIMSEVPHWASGCPIKVESETFNRYKK